MDSYPRLAGRLTACHPMTSAQIIPQGRLTEGCFFGKATSRTDAGLSKSSKAA